ncbi:Transmembrane protease serine [Trichinella pseudospiralis]
MWLQLDESAWPKMKIGPGRTPEKVELERRKTALIMTTSLKFDLWSVMEIARYGSYGKLIQVTAWCLRFISNAGLPMELRQKTRGLSVTETREAEKTWIRQVQVSAYGPGSHRRKDLQQFNLCLDEDGILRVGGRLTFAELPQETRNPILLPHDLKEKGMLMQQLTRNMSYAARMRLLNKQHPIWFVKCLKRIKKMKRETFFEKYLRMKYTDPYTEFKKKLSNIQFIEGQAVCGIQNVKRILLSDSIQVNQLYFALKCNSEKNFNEAAINELIGLAKRQLIELNVLSSAMITKISGCSDHEGVCADVTMLPAKDGVTQQSEAVS